MDAGICTCKQFHADRATRDPRDAHLLISLFLYTKNLVSHIDGTVRVLKDPGMNSFTHSDKLKKFSDYTTILIDVVSFDTSEGWPTIERVTEFFLKIEVFYERLIGAAEASGTAMWVTEEK